MSIKNWIEWNEMKWNENVMKNVMKNKSVV